MNCLFDNHKYGEKLFDENGYPYEICLKCGKKRNYRPKTLSDVDKMTMDEIGKQESLSQEENLNTNYNIVYVNLPNCDKCGGGLKKVDPERIINELTLYECTDCKERCYK
jgi:Zn ribbon nucleic-acid-binding protein